MILKMVRPLLQLSATTRIQGTLRLTRHQHPLLVVDPLLKYYKVRQN